MSYATTPFYILHIAETKQAVDIEASCDVIPYEGRTRLVTHKNTFASPGGIAVKASVAAEGADLWVNPGIDSTQLIYFSDPPRKAIKEAGIKARAMSMRECLVLP